MARPVAFTILTAALSIPTSLSANDVFDGTQKQFDGGYIIYSRDLGDWAAPNRHDAKVNLELRGHLARKMYVNMGPATEIHQCVPEGEHIREEGDLDCTRFGDGRFTCHIGINIKTGKSIGGSIC